MKSSREDGRGHWPSGKTRILEEKHLEILRLLRAGYAICKVASIVGVGVRTVQRRVELIRTRTAQRDQLEIDYRRVIKTQRCPVHGPVKVWPCVACAAEAARRSVERN